MNRIFPDNRKKLDKIKRTLEEIACELKNADIECRFFCKDDIDLNQKLSAIATAIANSLVRELLRRLEEKS